MLTEKLAGVQPELLPDRMRLVPLPRLSAVFEPVIEPLILGRLAAPVGTLIVTADDEKETGPARVRAAELVADCRVVLAAKTTGFDTVRGEASAESPPPLSVTVPVPSAFALPIMTKPIFTVTPAKALLPVSVRLPSLVAFVSVPPALVRFAAQVTF